MPVTLQVMSWVLTIWVVGSLLIFLLARVLGGEVNTRHHHWLHTCFDYSTLCHLQVTYSQTLGVIGYSLLPLFVMAPIISLLNSYPWIAFFVKVIHHLQHSYYLAFTSATKLLYFYVDSSGIMVIFQCWLSTGSRRAQTQKTPLTLPGILALRLLSVTVHRSVTRSLGHLYTFNIITQSS